MRKAARLLAPAPLAVALLGCFPFITPRESRPLGQDSGLERVDILISGFA